MSRQYAAILSGPAARSQPPQTLSVPAGDKRWDLQGQARATEYHGRKCLFLDGGAAILNDVDMRDGVVDVDVTTPAARGFSGGLKGDLRSHSNKVELRNNINEICNAN